MVRTMALGTWLALVVPGITGAGPGHLATLTAAILVATAVVLLTSVAAIDVAIVPPTQCSSRRRAASISAVCRPDRLLALSVMRR